ncbi:MAG: ATP-binding cassette domain-containing protein, partial [Planctomycetota bacterium]
SLPKAERTGDIVASVRALTKVYPTDDGGEKVLYNLLELDICRAECCGVIAPNGAGKTTLVRCLLGEQQADSGKVSLGSNVAIGHFSQTDDWIDPDKNVYRFIQKTIKDETDGATELSEQESRTLAGAFLFSGEEQEKEMGVLSGGERSRARLAALFACRKNVLVLDEPTNHLDIPAAERLEEALGLIDPEQPGQRKGAFDGTLILISHDRALIDATCDRLIVLDGQGGADAFLGNYTEWRAREDRRARQYAEDAEKMRRTQRGKDGAPAAKASGAATPTADSRAKQALADTTPAKPTEKSKYSWMRLEQLEEKIARLEERRKEIDQKLADPDVWLDAERANKLTEERDGVTTELEPLEAEWLRKAE